MRLASRVKSSFFFLQHSADAVSEQSAGPECVQGAGDGSAVLPLHGSAAPLPSPLHPVPTGAAGMPKRLYLVNLSFSVSIHLRMNLHDTGAIRIRSQNMMLHAYWS